MIKQKTFLGFLGWILKWLLIICIGGPIVLYTLVAMIESENPYLALPAAIIVFLFIVGIVLIKPLIILYAIFKADEIIDPDSKEEEEQEDDERANYEKWREERIDAFFAEREAEDRANYEIWRDERLGR